MKCLFCFKQNVQIKQVNKKSNALPNFQDKLPQKMKKSGRFLREHNVEMGSYAY